MKTTTMTLLAGCVLVSLATAQLLPLPPLQRNLERLSQTTKATVYYAEHMARAITANGWVWSLPDEELSELLNALGPELVAARVTLQQAQAAAINAGLEAAGSPVRANGEPGRTWTIVDGVIVLDPLPEGVVEPDEDDQSQ